MSSYRTLTFPSPVTQYTQPILYTAVYNNMEGEEGSILQKSVIPNLLQDDFTSYDKQTFLTELCDEENDHDHKLAPAEIHKVTEVEEEKEVLGQQDKQKCFQKDIDFRQTLVDEDSFENILIHQEKNASHSLMKNISVLDLFACAGLVLAVVDFVFSLI